MRHQKHTDNESFQPAISHHITVFSNDAAPQPSEDKLCGVPLFGRMYEKAKHESYAQHCTALTSTTVVNFKYTIELKRSDEVILYLQHTARNVVALANECNSSLNTSTPT